MKLEPSSGLTIDIHTRFRKGCSGFPMRIKLEGSPMHVQVVTLLLQKNRPHIEIADDGELVHLCSLEQYTSMFLESFMEGTETPSGLYLLQTIPEEVLVSFAKHNKIPVELEEKSDVRIMLEEIAKKQPQTFFSLARSMGRLSI